MTHLAKISAIELSRPDTWENSVFITIDLDWATDEMILDTINLLKNHGAKATLMVTHPTALLESLRSDPDFELGIHPNFNPLLLADSKQTAGSAQIVSDLLKIVPQALCVRSHSMTQSAMLLKTFGELGLKYDLNTYVPHTAGMILKPWQHWELNLIKLPYLWEDDLHIIENSRANILDIAKLPGLKIFDFHPVHIFLNTENIKRYDDYKKSKNKDPKEFINRSNPGVRDLFIELISAHKEP